MPFTDRRWLFRVELVVMVIGVAAVAVGAGLFSGVKRFSGQGAGTRGRRSSAPRRKLRRRLLTQCRADHNRWKDWGQVLAEPPQQRLDADADDVVHQLDCTVQQNLRARFTRLMAVTGGTLFLPAVRDYAAQLHNIQLKRHGETTESG
ncbi:hypothetical protein ACIBG0_22725 [Nocardia sp. NPDC050630]|uniref:hypothetical protein n=1 Tax=Nocardia sp. NPDC050630 TaxID=3364321 RepID=UPI0037AF2B48